MEDEINNDPLKALGERLQQLLEQIGEHNERNALVSMIDFSYNDEQGYLNSDVQDVPIVHPTTGDVVYLDERANAIEGENRILFQLTPNPALLPDWSDTVTRTTTVDALADNFVELLRDNDIDAQKAGIGFGLDFDNNPENDFDQPIGITIRIPEDQMEAFENLMLNLREEQLTMNAQQEPERTGTGLG